jgi:hypothetical protein
VEIEVSDTGRGIPPGEFDRIFEMATRGSNAGDRGGTGLGLSIVQRVVQERGGTVSVRSTVGAGSTFTLRLPDNAPVPPAAPVALPTPRANDEGAVIRADPVPPLPDDEGRRRLVGERSAGAGDSEGERSPGRR